LYRIFVQIIILLR